MGKKGEKLKKEKMKPIQQGNSKPGQKEEEKNIQVKTSPEEKIESRDVFWHPPTNAFPSPISPEKLTGEDTLQYVTPCASEVIPFYYEQRPLNLNLTAREYLQKIQEYGLSKVDIYIPSDDISKELRRFKTLPPDSFAIFEHLLADKSSIVKKRLLIILQYLYMVSSLV